MAPTGPDLILGGEGNDVLSGGGGDDRIVGDRGSDTMNGGAGDDTLVWNNGDGSDVANGDDGRDDVEVNGAPAAGDIFTVQPNGARIKFDRTNLVPFTIDIGSSETMHANGLGGNDSLSVGEVGAYEVTGSGGPGNDTLTGGGSSETFLGGSGNDTITPGGGIDVVSGDDGDDQVNIRDRTADLARGGAGNDSVVADNRAARRPRRLRGRRPHAERHTPARARPPHAARQDPRRHGEGEEGDRVDQGERPGGRVRQLHRLAHGAHRQGRQARRAEGDPAARQRALQHRPRRLEDAEGEAGQGQPAAGRQQGRLKVVAVASTGASGKIAQSSQRLIKNPPPPPPPPPPDPGAAVVPLTALASPAVAATATRDRGDGPAKTANGQAGDGRRREQRPRQDPRRLAGPHALPVPEGRGDEQRVPRRLRQRLAAAPGGRQADSRQRRECVDGRNHHTVRRQATGHLRRPPALPLRGDQSRATRTARA